jgi:hypothetical protein
MIVPTGWYNIPTAHKELALVFGSDDDGSDNDRVVSPGNHWVPPHFVQWQHNKPFNKDRDEDGDLVKAFGFEVPKEMEKVEKALAEMKGMNEGDIDEHVEINQENKKDRKINRENEAEFKSHISKMAEAHWNIARDDKYESSTALEGRTCKQVKNKDFVGGQPFQVYDDGDGGTTDQPTNKTKQYLSWDRCMDACEANKNCTYIRGGEGGFFCCICICILCMHNVFRSNPSPLGVVGG